MQLHRKPVSLNSVWTFLRSLFGRWLRGFILMSLTCVSSLAFSEAAETFLLDRYAPTAAELTRWSEDGLLLAEFGQVAEFIGREASAKDKAIRDSLELECAIKAFVECHAYINANRKAVLHALPDNPRYWALLWQVAKVPTLVDFSSGVSEQMDGYARLVNGSYWWFYRDLANSGRVDIEHAVAFQQAARNWSTGHQTLMARMVGFAVQGIIVDQMSFAMAQLSHNHNRDQLSILIRLLKPPKLNDMSWGPVFWVEQEWQLRSIKEALPAASTEVDIEAAMVDFFGMVDEALPRGMFEDPVRYHKSGFNVIAEHYLPISTMPWNQYWQKGVLPPDEEKFDKFSPAAVAAPSFRSYLVTERIGNFQYFLLSALAEIYAGKASPGLPALPAPEHWRWNWVDGVQPKLCLAAENIHPSTFPTSDDSALELCVEYYDAKALVRFQQR